MSGSNAVGALVLSVLLPVSGCGFFGEGEGDPGVDHRVYEGEAPAYEVPGSVSRVAWEWEVPDQENSLVDVLPGRSGPVMVLGDGLVGLDGATGEELWHYRLEGGGVHGAWVTPEGEEILLSLPGAEPDSVVLLDAGTGRLLAENEMILRRKGSAPHATVTSQVVVPPPQREGPVEAFSFREGERVWSYVPAGRADGTEVLVEDVVSAGDTVVVVMAHGLAGLEHESGDLIEQGMLVVGLDGETGEPVWEVEQEFMDESYRVAKHELSPGAEVLFLEVGVGDQRHEFLIDPATGAEIEGAAYQEPERYRVGLLDDGYVETAADYDAGTVEYWYTSFEGEEVYRSEVGLRPAEGDIDRGLLLEEGVLRTDYLTDPDLDRGPVNVEFARWGEDGDPLVLKADMTANEEWWLESKGSVMYSLPDAPVLVPVPGAVVVTEENRGPWTVTGLI
ncbi:outer membrane protein assembly factor BamB family protein [Nocardiopsis alkaliphila]|uniref:outer membrane protein assembly factor BamB family protein n=1 Tax=Nocardiopsis alkaliphila TaxID=225762 RepID=UPI00034D43C7|nr:PQQ-binding-like beta-propeller repeat protein [Nocardiopsis alkaliphila]